MYSASFQATADDLIAAYRLNYLTSLKTRRVVLAYVVGGVVVAAVALAITWIWDGTGEPIVAIVGLAYWTGLLSCILLAVYLRLPKQVRRIFRQQKALHENTTVEWSDAGISFQSTRGNSRFDWQDFIAIAEGRSTIILRQSDALFNFIPKTALSAEQAAAIMRFGAHGG